jgi:predicted nucleic acid-binding protein
VFADWHPFHDAARATLGRDPSIVAHAAFETYSVLTRMQEPHRVEPGAVRDWLELEFADRWLGLSTRALRLALTRLADLGVFGGATYDGLVAMTAAAEGATLVTLDRRALGTYARVGVDVEFVA